MACNSVYKPKEEPTVPSKTARPDRSESATVSLVGHPFTTIGKGEELRAAFHALNSVHCSAQVYDVFGHSKRSDPEYVKDMAGAETSDLQDKVRIFHINGDEVARVFKAMEANDQQIGGGYNVVVPAWELPLYPKVWVDGLKKFDAVWSISRFVQKALKTSGVDSEYVGQAVEILSRPFLPRREFGIRASAFVFLTYLDLSSYSTRKNPEAVLEMFRRVRETYPFDDIQLVVKVKNGDREASEWVQEQAGSAGRDVVFIDWPLSMHQVHSLVAACDCFVSLHRSEGFGRGSGEAMWLARSAIATNWSGNTDYMDASYPGAVDYTLVDVEDGQYPHWHGQNWAEPDIDHATSIAEKMVSEPSFYRDTCRLGQSVVRQSFSFRAVGLRMLHLLEERGFKAL